MTTVARLRALVTVADAGSVREAARRLTVTESAVSAALSALAREVRVPLVERDGRGLRLTASGQAYSVYARAILGLHEEGLAAARGDSDPERGRVRIAATATAGEYLLPVVLADFLSHHPGVDLRLEVGSSERLWALFAAHEGDLVIGGRPPGHIGDALTRATRLNLLVVVAAPDVAANFDIRRTRWLQREAGSGTRAAGEALLGGLEEVAVPGTPLRRPWHAVTHGRQPGATALLVRHLLDREGWRAPRGVQGVAPARSGGTRQARSG